MFPGWTIDGTEVFLNMPFLPRVCLVYIPLLLPCMYCLQLEAVNVCILYRIQKL